MMARVGIQLQVQRRRRCLWVAECFRLRQMCSQRKERSGITYRVALNAAGWIRNPADSWHSEAELGPCGLGGSCLVGTSEVMEEAPHNAKSIRRAYSDLVKWINCYWVVCTGISISPSTYSTQA